MPIPFCNTDLDARYVLMILHMSVSTCPDMADAFDFAETADQLDRFQGTLWDFIEQHPSRGWILLRALRLHSFAVDTYRIEMQKFI